MSAVNAAHKGAAALVPPARPCWPLFAISQMESDRQATSGMLRLVVEAWLADVLTPCCQEGIGYAVLIPPPLSGQVVSDTHAPPDPVVVRVVPPTTVR